MTALLVWIVRILVILLVIRLVMRALGMTRGRGIPRPRARDVERAGGTLVQDPQCGTYLPKSRALAVTAGGQTKYFCSPACRDAYESSPAAHASSPRPHASSLK